MAFDVLIRGGTVVDGTGSPGRLADVAVSGDRIAAIGNLGAVGPSDVADVIDATGLVVAPGFVDPHGHSDGTLLVDGALVSHLRQGFTTQLSGNCGYTFAPLTASSRAQLASDLAFYEIEPAWSTFGEYMDAVDAVELGINVAMLVGHGTVRAAVLGASDRAPDAAELAAMVRHVDEALDAGAAGVSSGLIYLPGLHARADEVAAVVAPAGRRGRLYATHMRNEAAGVERALDEAISTAAAAGARLEVSHLKAGARAVWGLGPRLVERVERARASGQDVAADQYPYTAAATTLATVLPPEILALEPDDAVAALRDPGARRRIRELQASGVTGWENVAQDPGWAGIVISRTTSRPEWNGRSLADIAGTEGRDAADLALDVLADDRLSVDVVIHCMDHRDLDAIMKVPWIGVCTDAEGLRPGHRLLDAGVPHPRAYGSTGRVLGEYVRDRRVLPLETAIAKLSAVPAGRVGLADRGQVREGWVADLAVFDPAIVADRATYERPAVHPDGILHVVVNGRLAVRDGVETGERAGRLLRSAG
jgi:N-acyl-D-amino-acid deacylase